jgi:hypothetical protein
MTRTRRPAAAWMLLSSLACLQAVVLTSGRPARAAGPAASLPCAIQITEEKIESLPDYMGPRNPLDMDFPYCPVMIDGEYWVIYKNGYRAPVVRFKGTNIENAVRQLDGAAKIPLRAPYMLGGMWYDAAGKTLYAPMHCEQSGYSGNILREIHLASSADKGLTWKYEGPIMTRDAPGKPRAGHEFSGLQWDGGDGDHVLCVDDRGGYIYLYTNHYVWPKTASGGAAIARHHVARCAIADKMAPGKWRKFFGGRWEEPGLGGKATYVDAYCVSHNSYLGKYMSLNYYSGIAFCDDLSKQEWSPSFRLGSCWGRDNVWGYWATNAEKNDVFHSGQTMFAYRFWRTVEGRRFRITLDKNRAPEQHPGFNPSSFFLNYGGTDAETADPAHYYGNVPLFESSDPIEARRTRRVDAASAEVKYAGSWSGSTAAERGASLEFAFQGSDIYWRAAKGPNMGKADVYLDGTLQTTVDCWASAPTLLQFPFLKRGLNDKTPHTIKVVVKNEKNPRSTGTAIRHILFEYSADTYRASDGYSSVQGKNQWRYQERAGGAYADMAFTDPDWHGAGRCQVGYFHMTPDVQDAVRKWIAPHDGMVRIEGAPSLEGTDADGFAISLVKNTNELWSSRLLSTNALASTHDLTVAVHKGDAIAFVVHELGKSGPGLDVIANHGPVQRNTRNGTPLKIGKKEFARGLFCHAPSKVLVRLPGPGKTFSAVAGADDGIGGGNPAFSVTVGGKVAFKLDVPWGKKEAVPISVDLAGASEFVLEVGDGGNGISCDWADWADAKTILTDGKEVWLSDLPLNQGRVLWDPVITYVGPIAGEK